MKIKNFLILMQAFIMATAFSSCYELVEDDDIYFECLNENTKLISCNFDNLNVIDEYNLSLKLFLKDDDSDKFYTDDDNGYKFDNYKYYIVDIKADCYISEFAIYIRYDSGTSGKNASTFLSVQFFNLNGEINKDFIENSNDKITQGTAGLNELYKAESDASLALEDGEWNDGNVVDTNQTFFKKGDKLVIKFVDNCDFTEEIVNEGEDDEEITYVENTENDISFKLDKVLIRVDKEI